eukprot:TRINITY_DN4606_c0_g2_i1.p1 TRINITY_DN4606_c0_g2~~TRINITY_DN4606_c0_g2_i1.p1  ORF type:complete len:250 (+),score=49.02 TRINITY_DN4606_c0_g2_i1:56-805(+)
MNKKSAKKRKLDDDDDEENDPKRARYTAIACNQCRQRKTKCSGDKPACTRCLERSVECVYRTKRKVNGIDMYVDDSSYSTEPTYRTIDSTNNTFVPVHPGYYYPNDTENIYNSMQNVNQNLQIYNTNIYNTTGLSPINTNRKVPSSSNINNTFPSGTVENSNERGKEDIYKYNNDEELLNWKNNINNILKEIHTRNLPLPQLMDIINQYDGNAEVKNYVMNLLLPPPVASPTSGNFPKYKSDVHKKDRD